MVLHLLLHLLGIDTQHSPWYDYWSGVGTQFQIAKLGLVAAVWRRFNCHHAWCLRIGRHPAAGGRFTTCRRHHPDPQVRGGLKAHHIHAAHQAHEGTRR